MDMLTSTSAEQTQEFAATFAAQIQALPPLTHARVIELIGDLGAGKTTFIQGFARALGVKHHVTSPTFLLMKRYPLKNVGSYKNLYHLDAYRVAHIDELTPLAFATVLADPKNIVLIEWANNLKDARFFDAIRIEFRHGKSEDERIIAVTNSPEKK